MININGKNKKVVGFICECNPFHKGHKRLINEAKKYGDYIVAVMSGNYVQRGEPAVYDKYRRTEELIKNGVDLIVELPIEFVMSSAKYFASAGVSILNSLGFVDYMIFGSQIGDIEKLKKIASVKIDSSFTSSNNANMQLVDSIGKIKCNNKERIGDEEANKIIRKYLREGRTYSYAVGKALGVNLSSNDILAIEYIRALNEIKSKIEPLTIKRLDNLPTASELRERIKKRIICDSFSEILNYKLLLAKNIKENVGKSILSDIYLMTSDMENAILNKFSNKGVKKDLSFTERAMSLKTKNVTLAYIKRLFFNIIFDIRKNDVVLKSGSSKLLHLDEETRIKKIEWIRVLGFKKKSSDLLKKIKIPMLMSYSIASYKTFVNKYKIKAIKQNKNGEFILSPILQKNIFSSDLYYLLSGQKCFEAEWQVVRK